VQWGATALPLAAQLEYRQAVVLAADGNLPGAEKHLQAAIRLAPGYPDSYFTMSQLKFRQFDPDALYFFVRGVRAVWNDFHTQSLLVVNVLLIGAFTLIVAASIVLLALALRYLPFVAHRLAEGLGRRFRTAMPRTTAYLLISIPFALFPGFVSGACVLLIMTWYFMQRRERFGVFILLLPFMAMGLFSGQLERFSPAADPTSFTSMAARSNYAAGDADLLVDVARVDIEALHADQHNVLGVLYLRQEDYQTAANHFLQAIARRPDDATAYVNLGNVYFENGLYNKALEGYRKATAIDSLDAVTQYNLAQAYIKTLLMAESSKALHEASQAGIDQVRQQFAADALPTMDVYPKALTTRELWSIAAVEGAERPTGFVAGALEPALGFPLRVSAWLLLGAFALALVLSRALKPRQLAFQCSNCGELMCESCGSAERGSWVCRNCGTVIAEVSSDRVVDALLRQRRQRVVVKRRRIVRLLTLWLPGLRDVFYGNVTRGIVLTLLFSISALELWTRGYMWPDWNSFDHPASLWKWVLPAAGIALAYLVSASSRRLLEVRNYRTPDGRQRSTDGDESQLAQSA
jgi:tetratricopeptide (TPR) repeat protein